jgi:prevent-host-death family protein
MDEVGIRELNQQTGRVLRRVADGTSLVVTDHGRPVAMLTPLPADALERLERAGELVRRPGPLQRVERVQGRRPSEELIAELREDRG